jgi:hypothetical protein
LGTDVEAFLKPEFYKSMKTGNMVNVKVTDEREYGFFLGDVLVRFVNTIPRVKYDIKLFRLDKDRAGSAGCSIIPAIGT